MVTTTLETPDIESSTDDYATRFAGGIGRWFLHIQLKATLRQIGNMKGVRILDVGGGHGQLLGGLLNAGHRVTVTGSNEGCSMRIRKLLDNDRAAFKVCPLTNLDFEDGAFDVAISYRMMSHLEHWRTLVEELCRVSSGKVIIDYPTYRSFNVLNGLLFRLKHGVEKNTREFAIFHEAEVIAEFEKHGYRQTKRYGQYVLPMALHRAHRCRSLAVVLEGALRLVGLAWLFGSPVIACFEKNES